MDTEWKIKQLEEEARHEKAMRELQGTRLDAHDRSIAAIHEILDRTERNIEALAAAQLITEKMLQAFIESLGRAGNGKH